MKLDYPVVRDWALISKDNHLSLNLNATGSSRLYGRVKSSNKFKDDTWVATSPIVKMIEEQDVVVVFTKNSKYIVREKEVLKKYEDQIGHVWEKLKKNIDKE